MLYWYAMANQIAIYYGEPLTMCLWGFASIGGWEVSLPASAVKLLPRFK
jgi:hypothetical protein